MSTKKSNRLALKKKKKKKNPWGKHLLIYFKFWNIYLNEKFDLPLKQF